MSTKYALCSTILIVIVLLLSFAILSQNQLSLQLQKQSSLIPSLAYADKIRLKNKSFTNDISDQLPYHNTYVG